GGYDHNYVLNPRQTMKRAAVVRSEKTGIVMEVLTTQPGMQLYTGNFITPQDGKNGHRYDKRSGFCMETQHFPNGMACPSFPSPVLKAGETYHEITVYSFQ
ncbi:MAG: galactose-1-epimerase, partial [Oscillospiraceae bacterium]|nr:galactose-1-epimerase [Oscillospiraceae bacterium]